LRGKLTGVAITQIKIYNICSKSQKAIEPKIEREGGNLSSICAFFYGYFSRLWRQTMSGKNLQIERIRAGIKQSDLAEALKMDRTLLSKIENNKIEISEDFEKQYLARLKELREKKNEN